MALQQIQRENKTLDERERVSPDEFKITALLGQKNIRHVASSLQSNIQPTANDLPNGSERPPIHKYRVIELAARSSCFPHFPQGVQREAR